jgi:hypothetical protein
MGLVALPVEAHVGGHEFRLGKDLLGWLQLLTKLGAFWDLEKEGGPYKTRIGNEKKTVA